VIYRESDSFLSSFTVDCCCCTFLTHSFRQLLLSPFPLSSSLTLYYKYIVFLAVKYAYDVLSDPLKRQGYDSTVLAFDDTIPPSRSSILLQSSVVEPEEDFYQLYGPVFVRNLRFDARLRPENHKGSSGSNTTSARNHHQQPSNHHHKKTVPEPPSLGDATTPMDQVHVFYDYWIHFTSWRDFSTQATLELQLQDEMEHVESRYEKRYLQKEIDKRTKQLKRNEMIRIQTLVERAMEADPRLYV
jgi:DnaJ homolog subfamily C member 2